MTTAGTNETAFKKLITSKFNGFNLKGKKRFVENKVNISVDESFKLNNINYLIEIDSGNMAKFLVGQYVLLNQLISENKSDYCFLIVHTYKDYNIDRTLNNLNFINKRLYNNRGLKFGVIHFENISNISGLNIQSLLTNFTYGD